jgi:hypothetical protein
MQKANCRFLHLESSEFTVFHKTNCSKLFVINMDAVFIVKSERIGHVGDLGSWKGNTKVFIK